MRGIDKKLGKPDTPPNKIVDPFWWTGQVQTGASLNLKPSSDPEETWNELKMNLA